MEPNRQACHTEESSKVLLRLKEATMESDHVEKLRAELGQLLKKQTEVLESRTFGRASDTELLEYEIRQEIIHEICGQLANSTST
jgi:hypothetical protein